MITKTGTPIIYGFYYTRLRGQKNLKIYKEFFKSLDESLVGSMKNLDNKNFVKTYPYNDVLNNGLNL